MVKCSGNWVFCDGTISSSDIYDLYIKHFHAKILYIVVDYCYVDQWIQNLAKCLTSQGIGGRGQDKGILIKIMAACQPDESAYDDEYSDASDPCGTAYLMSSSLVTNVIWPIVRMF